MMSHPAYSKFFPRISSGGRGVINSSLVSDNVVREDVEVIRIPANEIAEDIGSPRIVNMVVLGAWIKKSGIVSVESLVLSLGEVISKSKRDLLSLNEEALGRGSHFVSSSG
jgi:2-oxoglutarate ferredoxin oxidoreductase subunit gamma